MWQTLQEDGAVEEPGPWWFFLIPPEMAPADVVNELLAILVDGFRDPDADGELSLPGRRRDGEFRCDFERLTRKALDAAGKRVVILCAAAAEARAEHAALETEVVEHVSESLRLHKIDAADPQRVADWAKSSGGVTVETDLADVAGKFSADYVVLFKFDEFGCSEEEGEKWLRGHARGKVVVLELAAAEDDPSRIQAREIYAKPFVSRYPAHLPVSVDEEPRDDFQRRFLQNLAETLSQLLYDPDALVEVPEGPRA